MRGVYLFEAKGIQRYLFDSGQLRDVIGASEIAAGLTRSRDGEKDLLAPVLTALDLGNRLTFSRRASAALMAHGEVTDLGRLRELWRLTVQMAVPGLEFSDVLLEAVSGEDDLALWRRAYAQGSGVRENSAAGLLPLGTPFSFYVPRTGRVQVGWRRLPEGRDPVDAVVARQAEMFEALQASKSEGVADRFLDAHADANGLAYRFPRRLDPHDGTRESEDNPSFPFDGRRRWVGLVHADVSGLGQLWYDIAASEALKASGDVSQLRSLSTAIEEAIARAAKAATSAVLLPRSAAWPYGSKSGKTRLAIVPARPLVLGGDDMTAIVRADLAFNFARRLLEGIEEKTREAFEALKQDGRLGPLAQALPGHLSACAGLVFARANQPFLMLHALADGLCKHAKKAAKRGQQPFPSAMACHVVSTSLQEDYAREIVPTEYTDIKGRVLTLQPLFTDGSRRPSCGALNRLVDGLRKAEKGSGKLKALRADLFADAAAADQAWRRWREVLGEEGALRKIDEALEGLGARDVATGVPFTADTPAATPLFDALRLIDLGHRP